MKVEIRVMDYSKGFPYKKVDSWIINTDAESVPMDIVWYQENCPLADYQFIEGVIIENE